MIDDRIGLFRIPMNMIRKQPFEVMKIMSKFVVLRAESMAAPDSVEYTALSTMFSQINVSGSVIDIPEYDVTLEKDGRVTAKKTGRICDCH